MVKLPAGYVTRHAPEAKKISSPFGEFDLQVDQGTPGKLGVKAKLTLTKTRVEPAEYGAFRTFCQDVDKALGDRAVFGK